MRVFVFVTTMIGIGISQQAVADDFFRDEFDGSESVEWQTFSGGNWGDFSLADGNLILNSTDDAIWGNAFSGFVQDDMSIRTQLRFGDSSVRSAGLAGRFPRAGRYYSGWVSPVGEMGITVVRGPAEGGGFDVEVLKRGNASGLDGTATDINLQFDMFGDVLSLTAWPEGSVRPDGPQVSVVDSTYSTGDRVFMVIDAPLGKSTEFRFFETAPQPWDPMPIVSPSEFASIDAPNVADFLPEEYRLQQLYVADEFVSVPSNYLITGARWRTDAALDVPVTASAEQWIATMSTTPRAIGELDSIFAENPGDDVTMVFDGPVSWDVTHDEASEGLGAFAFDLEFQKAFPYDPKQGNLLFDLTVVGGSERLGMDFSFPPTGTTQIIWTGLNGDATNQHASDDRWGGHVVEYTFESVDCNGDGLVNLRDANCSTAATVDGTLQLAGLIPGDIDGNGTVEFEDFLILSDHFGSPGEYTDGNLDRIDNIGFTDFLILSQNFGKTSANMSAVPEPSASVLVALAVVALASNRRQSIANRKD